MNKTFKTYEEARQEALRLGPGFYAKRSRGSTLSASTPRWIVSKKPAKEANA
jgi:hypothetical protein